METRRAPEPIDPAVSALVEATETVVAAGEGSILLPPKANGAEIVHPPAKAEESKAGSTKPAAGKGVGRSSGRGRVSRSGKSGAGGPKAGGA